jgi:hypothetical protein
VRFQSAVILSEGEDLAVLRRRPIALPARRDSSSRHFVPLVGISMSLGTPRGMKVRGTF